MKKKKFKNYTNIGYNSSKTLFNSFGVETEIYFKASSILLKIHRKTFPKPPFPIYSFI